MFQFPSNGKVYSKLLRLHYLAWDLVKVSIPFKRESVFKGELGKIKIERKTKVSIPFKRESVFKERRIA